MISLFRLPLVLSALALVALAIGTASPATAGGPANYSVDTTSNVSLAGCDGATLEDCSLRGAIDKSNANGGSVDTITFNIPMSDIGCNAGTGVCTINPDPNLPTISDPVIINGLSQPGASAGNLKIELQGPANMANAVGLLITSGDTTVSGLVVNHFETGIMIQTGGGNIIKSNFVGVDPAGAVADGNTLGVSIFPASAGNNVIGGTAAGDGNLISGNFLGIGLLNSSGDFVQGNRIGTDAAGMSALPNATQGIRLDGMTNTTIGGTAVGARNVISGNSGQGIEGVSGSGVLVQGNYIGVGADGTTPVGNSGAGIFQNGAFGYTIGGTAPGAGNVIAHNLNGGIALPFPVSVPILGNSIHSNGGLGIDLGVSGVAPNDAGDGGTALQNYPVLTGIFPSGGSTTIEGSLNGTASTTFRLEFFYGHACDPSEHGEGQFFIGSGDQVTNAGGNANFSVTLPTVIAAGATLTATATNPDGGTSEFSHCYNDPVKGDVDCNGTINSVDSLKLLRFSSALSVAQIEPCPDIGRQLNAIPEEMGDVNCNDDENSVDSLLILRHNAGLSVNLPQGCRVIGTIHGTVITATDFAWTPDAFSAAKGRLVGFSVRNDGAAPHALRIAGTDNAFGTADDAVATPATTLPAQKSSAAWQTPDQAGPIMFRCDFHPGMTGTINLK